MKTLSKWVLRLALLAAVATAIARVVAKLSEDGSAASPVIGGDTWPPVPSKREGPN